MALRANESQNYSSYFKFHVRWQRSVTRITYLSKLIGIPSLAACLKLELFRVYISRGARWRDESVPDNQRAFRVFARIFRVYGRRQNQVRVIIAAVR